MDPQSTVFPSFCGTSGLCPQVPGGELQSPSPSPEVLLEFSAIANQVFTSSNTVSQHHQVKEQCCRDHVTASTLRLNSADCRCLLPALMQATRLPWRLLEVGLLPQHSTWHAGTAGQLR